MLLVSWNVEFYTCFMQLLFIFLLGLATGSFLNVLIDRLPQDRSILGRSQCDFCKKKLKAKDLVPVFSYLVLKGKCRYCSKKLSTQYPIVELLTGIVFVLTWSYIPIINNVILGTRQLAGTPESILIRFWTSQNDILRLLYLGLISSLIVIFFADWKYHVIPDQMQIILFVFSAAIIYLEGFFTPFSFLIRLSDGLIVMLPILGLYLLTKGKGMGFGDVKLAFIIGFFLQIVAGLLAIYFAFVSGAIFGGFLVFLKKKKFKDSIAFGPFLALGFAVMIFFGKPIIEFLQRFYFNIGF